MSTINISNLPRKFQPFLIGSPACHEPCQEEIQEEIDTIINQGALHPLKRDYIFEAGRWVLKLRCTDVDTTPDTHLYRVRKAEKIRTYIRQNDLEDHIAVPKKYLYWNTTQNQFYTIAEKMELSSDVVALASVALEDDFKKASDLGGQGGQMEALARGAPKRSLTAVQARDLAKLAILVGYTDLSYNNLYFTNEGKVAILDTEPQKRSLKKRERSSPLFFFKDRGALLTQQSIAGIAKLKLYTDTQAALEAVQKVERNHVLWRIAQLITKIFLLMMGLCFFPTIAALIPIAELAITLCLSFAVLATVKNYFLTLDLFNVCLLWLWSCQGGEGVAKIVNMERNGKI